MFGGCPPARDLDEPVVQLAIGMEGGAGGARHRGPAGGICSAQCRSMRSSPGHRLPRKLSARSELAEALRYISKQRTALTRVATDARLEADNNIAENAIRSIALGRRNWLFAGSHSGGERAAALYSILQTTKLNGVNPRAYLTDPSPELPKAIRSAASPN
jgi:Transposase IS66 family